MNELSLGLKRELLLFLLKIFCITVLAVWMAPAWAQTTEQERLLDEMLFVNTSERQNKIYAFLAQFPKDSASIMKAYKMIGNHGRKHGDALLELCEPSGLLSIVRNSKTASNLLVKTTIDSVYRLYRQKEAGPIFYASMERHMGTYYLNREKNYAIGFEYLNRAYDLLKAVDMKKHSYKATEAHWLIFLHDEFDDHDRIIEIGKEILKEDSLIKERWISEFIKIDIASAYRGLGLLDSSDIYLKKVIHEKKTGGVNTRQGLALCLLGLNMESRKDLNGARENLEQGLNYLRDNANYKAETVRFSSLLAKLLAQEDQLKKARAYMNICTQTGVAFAYGKDKPEIYKNLSFVSSAFGDTQNVMLYLDSADISEQHKREFYDSRKFLRTRQQKEIEQAEKEKASIVFWRNIMLYFLTFAFLVAILFYWIKVRKKQVQLQQIQQELEYSQNELRHLTQLLRGKSILQNTDGPDNEFNPTLQILEESTILTKDEWETFKFHFEKVYPGFLKNLVITYPDLTQGEIRFLSLKKLGLSNKEMAETLGVSDQSIRTTLHRLRKKVNLSSEADIEILIENL